MIDEIKKQALNLFRNARSSHDWEHTERVRQLCMKIGEKEDADLEVLEIASILHDIGRTIEGEARGKMNHAEQGAIMAEEILKSYPIADDKKQNIIHCIRTHRFRGHAIPDTLEAKVLYDADKLDSIGAIGIGRAFIFSGEIGSKLHVKDIDPSTSEEYSDDDCAYREYLVKLVKIKDKILTTEGKRLAEERHAFMVEFFERLNQEVDDVL
ncbi:MAG TPA: HD domain-containing protein [Candidatus Cloacimonadota bacterium]|nr:HD domain-containing protein [Candidatus Cloacimonadota bacterium]HPT72870.1 HD domain-containing protein [Candidatus Cloacimonadota bacterium]